MADGVRTNSSVLKIGFLFDHVITFIFLNKSHPTNFHSIFQPEDNLPNYLDAFDIVLIDDQTMDVPIKLISLIAAYKNGNN